MAPTTSLIPMIAHPTSEGWDIIHQQAHGLLAYQIGTHWKTNQRSIFWAQTLTALLEHDDGQQPFAGHNHLSQAGAPLSFQPYSVPQCHRMIDIALCKSRWNALMVSHHSTFLYQPTGGKDNAMDEFLKQQKSNQKKWRTAYGASQKEVVYAYELVPWCDALSLILCRNQLPPEARQLEISKGPNGATYFIHQRADNSLRVDPWPFESAEFRVCIEVYPVAQLQFIDDGQLYKAINEAPVEIREWVFRYT